MFEALDDHLITRIFELCIQDHADVTWILLECTNVSHAWHALIIELMEGRFRKIVARHKHDGVLLEMHDPKCNVIL